MEGGAQPDAPSAVTATATSAPSAATENMEKGGSAMADATETAEGEGRRGGRFFYRPALGKKLFKLKSLSELQDTEANNDDSQFKVGERDPLESTQFSFQAG